jgi:hypothetical protein
VEVGHRPAVAAVQPVAQKSQLRQVGGRRDATELESELVRPSLDLGGDHAVLLLYFLSGGSMALRRTGLMVVTLALLATAASAQDDPRIGVAMGYPASIGIVWHVTDGIALRPELSATSSSSDLTATTTSSSTVNANDNWQVLFGVSALFYLSKHEGLRTYVSPRWAYTRVESTSTSGSPSFTTGSTGNVQFVSGSFGAQYTLGRRFAVFGELGLGYTHTTNSPNSSSPAVTLFTESAGHTIGTRSGAGVILYF